MRLCKSYPAEPPQIGNNIVPPPRHRHKRRKAGSVPLPWAAGKYYRQGIIVTVGANSYQSLTDHTAEAGQDPITSPMLWQEIA